MEGRAGYPQALFLPMDPPTCRAPVSASLNPFRVGKPVPSTTKVSGEGRLFVPGGINNCVPGKIQSKIGEK